MFEQKLNQRNPLNKFNNNRDQVIQEEIKFNQNLLIII